MFVQTVRAICGAGLLTAVGIQAALAASCPAERKTPLLPSDTELCQRLAPIVAKPAALPLGDVRPKGKERVHPTLGVAVS